MSRVPTASLEPYLRARAVNPNLIRSSQPRRTVRHARSNNNDFVDFLKKLIKLFFSPVTIPLRWIHQAVTSPLTINLVLKLLLLFVLTLASAVFSFIAVGAWWYSWGTGAPVEVEGWLFYGSKSLRTPHVQISLPIEKFQEDLRYDVQVEMELVRPIRGGEEMGNFMLSLQLRSARDPDLVVLGAAQPSLPPPPLPSTLLSLPSFPIQLLPPCIIPWPFRSICPSRILGYDHATRSKIRERRKRGGFASPAQGKDVVLLKKELMEGVVILPTLGGDAAVGSVFVSIGREDSFVEQTEVHQNQPKEVRTTGWVVVRFVPRPTGIRWLLSAHPLPPLLLLPPLSLSLTISSSLFAFLLISYLIRPRTKPKKSKKKIAGTTEEALLEEKRRRTFEDKDRLERQEEERRKKEWEELESSALGGLHDIPAEGKRTSTVAGGSTTIGGSETTGGPSVVRSFTRTISTESGITERSDETERIGDGRRQSRGDTSDGWEEAE